MDLLVGKDLRPRVVETALGPVEYALTDGAGPVVLASHGGMGGVDQAGLLLGWLPPAYRRLAVSRPGYLRTPLAGRESFRAQADLFAALLDTLGLDRIGLVTLSSGGPAGYLLAAHHPDRVAALVAIASASSRYDATAAARSVGRLTEALFTSRLGQWLTRTLAARRPAWTIEQILRGESRLEPATARAQATRAAADPAVVRWLLAFLDTMSPYRERRPGTDNDTARLTDLAPLPLESIGCPTLVIHGTDDGDVPYAQGLSAYDRISGARLHPIVQGSHLGFWLAPGGAEARAAARALLTTALGRTTRGRDR